MSVRTYFALACLVVSAFAATVGNEKYTPAERRHWAFQPITKPAVPKVASASNPLDAFVMTRLEKEGLRYAPPASKETLIRRVTFDLTGLPPTLAEIDAFLTDKSPDAYDKLVDRLLEFCR